MADKLPGPSDRWEQFAQVNNGTSCLQAGGGRGPTAGADAGHSSEWHPLMTARRAASVYEAYLLGYLYAPAAIAHHTGMDDLWPLLKGLAKGLLQMLAILGAFMAIGGAAGAAVGWVFGLGVGALPAGVAGAKLGLDFGLALMTWLGLGVLLVDIAVGIPEVAGKVGNAAAMAWNAPDCSSPDSQVDAAGRLFADGLGKLMLLILMAIVARLTAGQLRAANARVATSSADLVAQLRQSKLGGGFADWVAANADKLVNNPRLRGHNAVGGTAAKAEAVTPSQLANRGASPPTTGQSAAQSAVLAEELARVGTPINGAIRKVPLGFEPPSLFRQAADELQQALKASGIDDATVGVRGSSVTGESLTKGTKFGPQSDIDFFVESAKLTEGYKPSNNIPGFVHPKKILPDYPLLEQWANKWSDLLGREVTPGAFQPGTLPTQPAILAK